MADKLKERRVTFVVAVGMTIRQVDVRKLASKSGSSFSFPGTDGLLHISEIADRRIRDVRDELKEGQQIMVKCIGKEGNKIKLSRKAVLKDENHQAEAATE